MASTYALIGKSTNLSVSGKSVKTSFEKVRTKGTLKNIIFSYLTYGDRIFLLLNLYLSKVRLVYFWNPSILSLNQAKIHIYIYLSFSRAESLTNFMDVFLLKTNKGISTKEVYKAMWKMLLSTANLPLLLLLLCLKVSLVNISYTLII